jgi:hypothetical protein
MQMNARTVAPTLPRRPPQLVVTIATAVLLSAASFQSAWAQTAPSLGTAKSFAVLGGQTVTNTGPSTIHGDLGVSPGSAVTGFAPGHVIAPGVIHAADAVALAAQNDLTTAYNVLAGEPSTFDETGHDLGGQTLVAGVYTFTSSAQLTGPLTLDAQGNANAVFIFQIGSKLTTASNSNVNLINGAQPCNVFWQVGSSATLGTNTSFIGNILALTSIALQTGTSVNGRALARNGAVTLDTNNVFFSDCAGSGPGGTGGGPVCTDVTPPSVALTGVIAGPPKQIQITVQDTGTGIGSIVVTLATNVTVPIPAFAPGITTPIVVTATKINQIQGSVVALRVTDLCGNVTNADPVDFTIAANKTVTVTGIPQDEHLVTIVNDGLQTLIITVNENDDKAVWVWLKPNETRTIDIGRAMGRKNNTITFEAIGYGSRHGSAWIVVHPGPAALAEDDTEGHQGEGRE